MQGGARDLGYSVTGSTPGGGLRIEWPETIELEKLLFLDVLGREHLCDIGTLEVHHDELVK